MKQVSKSKVNTSKMKPISKSYFVKFQNINNEYVKATIKRINYIVKTIVKVFGANRVSTTYIDKDYIYNNVVINATPSEMFPMAIENYGEDFCIIDNYNNEVLLDYAFPMRWLWENFEQELIDGKKKYENIKPCPVITNAALVASAKKKLTKNELDAIRLAFIKGGM